MSVVESRVPVSVVVVTRNENELLIDCLPRLAPAKEIVVLTMDRDPQTIELACSYGARVVEVRDTPIAENVRNEGLAAANESWVLFVDPDELVPEEFWAAVRPLLDDERVGAYRLAYSTFAFGRRMRYTLAGVTKIALIRKSGARWAENSPAHSEPILSGPVVELAGQLPPIEHHSFRDIGQVVEKLNRYAATGGALDEAESGLSPVLPLRSLYRELIAQRVWRDGAEGVAVAILISFGNVLAALYRWEAHGRPTLELSTSSRLFFNLLSRVVRSRSVIVRRVRR